MGYICCLGGFIKPSKSLGGKYEPSEKFRGQKQTLFYSFRLILLIPNIDVSSNKIYLYISILPKSNMDRRE
jgi:hypothetical protein